MVCSFLSRFGGSWVSLGSTTATPWNQRRMATLASNHHRNQVLAKSATIKISLPPPTRAPPSTSVKSIPYSLSTYYGLFTKRCGGRAIRQTVSFKFVFPAESFGDTADRWVVALDSRNSLR